jgi:hypothetical protein
MATVPIRKIKTGKKGGGSVDPAIRQWLLKHGR